MKAILLPTDFSNNAMQAIKYTVALLKNEPCTFYLMHVHQASAYISDDLMHMPTSDSIHKILVDNTKKALSDLVDQFSSTQNSLHEFKMLVDYDNFIDAIDQVSKRYNIDLIVMGMQGKSAAEQVLFGSHTIRVIQRTDLPVLVVPESLYFSGIDKVTLVMATHKKFSNRSVSIFKWLHDLCDFQTNVLDVIKNKTTINVEVIIAKLLENLPYQIEEIKAKDSLKTIQRYVKDNNSKLVVLGREKYSFLERLFTKHSVESLAYNLNVPLLVIGE